MTDHFKDTLEKFAAEGIIVDKAPNRLWIVASHVEDELANGTRESLLGMARTMNPVIVNLLKATESHREALLKDEADLNDPFIAAYFLGQFVMAQTMLNDMGNTTLATEDFEYLKTPEVVEVLKAIRDLNGLGTIEAIAAKIGKGRKETIAILNRTNEMTATYCVLAGRESVNRLGPCGKQILNMQANS